jgi:hypothetical protein
MPDGFGGAAQVRQVVGRRGVGGRRPRTVRRGGALEGGARRGVRGCTF